MIKKILQQYRNLYFQLENSTAIQTTSYAKILMELMSIVCNNLGTLPIQRDITVMKGFLATESVVRFFKKKKDLFFRSVVVILRSCTI